MIRLWAKIYKLTGWYSPWAIRAEYEMLEKEFPKFFKSFKTSVTIGSWQAHHGFTRRIKYNAKDRNHSTKSHKKRTQSPKKVGKAC